MDRYIQNPFRLFDLPPTASGTEIRRRAKALAQAIELGRPVVTASLGHLPPPASISTPTLQAAVRDLEDPVRRLRHEVFWPCLERTTWLLESGDIAGFVAACEAGSRAAGTEGALARHDLAVLHHSAAILASIGACPRQARQFSNWADAFQLLEAVRTDDDYWMWVARRVGKIGDARLHERDAENLRARLARDLLDANLALGARSDEDAWRQLALIHPAALPRAARLAACDSLLEPRRDAFERQRSAVAAKLADRELDAVAARDAQGRRNDTGRKRIYSYLQGVEKAIAEKVLPTADHVAAGPAKEMSAGVEILDGTAWLLRGLSIDFNNDADSPHEASRLTAQALRYASSATVRTRLHEDSRTLIFLALEFDAARLGAAGRWNECEQKLKEASERAQTPEQKLRTEEAASVARTNASGGVRSPQPPSGNPQARPRPSPGVAWVALGVIVAIVLISALVGGSGSSSGNQAVSDVGSVTSQPAAAPATTNAARAVLGSWLDTERTAIDRERASLQSEEDALAGEKDEIDLARLGLGDNPDQADLDAFNAKVDDYNARLRSLSGRAAALKERVGHYNAVVALYNEKQ